MSRCKYPLFSSTIHLISSLKIKSVIIRKLFSDFLSRFIKLVIKVPSINRTCLYKVYISFRCERVYEKIFNIVLLEFALFLPFMSFFKVIIVVTLISINNQTKEGHSKCRYILKQTHNRLLLWLVSRFNM